MSHIMNLTDKQWYNFICGMQAGLKLKDMTLPAFETSVVLTPIGIGGYGQIGLAIPQVLWDGVSTTGLIPVYTHDVDVGYAGFSCNITWDTSRLQVIGLTDGDFGAVGTYITYTINNGVCLVRGLREAPAEYTEPMILFYLSVNILDLNITKNTPIPIKLVSGTGYDPNYTTLLKYVQNDQDGQYYLYYITPIKNVSGAIVSDKEPNKAPIGDEKDVPAEGGRSGIFVGWAATPPGERGAVPIIANSFIGDNFPYNGIHTTIVVEDSNDIFTYLGVVGVDGWSLSTTTSINSDGYLVLDIIGSRSEAKQDSVTVGYIDYRIGDIDVGYYLPLNNILSELLNSMEVLNCSIPDQNSGAIIHNIGTGDGGDGGGGPGGPGGPGGMGAGGYGGVDGGGSVWSDSEQLIWVSINDAPKCPVWVQPGWNEIQFWIPFIFPDDEWIEAPLIIEAPGYILIPAGFEINIKTSEDAPVRASNPKMTDKLKFIDVYDIEIETVQPPVDLDGIFDEIIFEDIHAIDITNATLLAETSLIDNLNIEDIYNVEIEAEPFSGEFDKVEEVNLQDVNSITLVNTTIINNNDNVTEDVGFTDFVDIEK